MKLEGRTPQDPQVSLHDQVAALTETPPDMLVTPTAWLGRRPSHAQGDSDRWKTDRGYAKQAELCDQIAHLEERELPSPS